MEVLIKKCKLTRSILSQVTFISKEEILDGDFRAIGWCVLKVSSKLTVKYVVLNDESGNLRKILKYGFIHMKYKYLELDNSNTKLANRIFECSGDELNKLLHRLIAIQKDFDSAGQFYI